VQLVQREQAQKELDLEQAPAEAAVSPLATWAWPSEQDMVQGVLLMQFVQKALEVTSRQFEIVASGSEEATPAVPVSGSSGAGTSETQQGFATTSSRRGDSPVVTASAARAGVTFSQDGNGGDGSSSTSGATSHRSGGLYDDYHCFSDKPLMEAVEALHAALYSADFIQEVQWMTDWLEVATHGLQQMRLPSIMDHHRLAGREIIVELRKKYEPLQGTKFDEDPSNYLLQVEGAGNPVVDGCYQYSQETNYQHYHSTPQWAQVDNDGGQNGRQMIVISQEVTNSSWVIKQCSTYPQQEFYSSGATAKDTLVPSHVFELRAHGHGVAPAPSVRLVYKPWLGVAVAAVGGDHAGAVEAGIEEHDPRIVVEGRGDHDGESTQGGVSHLEGEFTEGVDTNQSLQYADDVAIAPVEVTSDPTSGRYNQDPDTYIDDYNQDPRWS